ncbi:MAG: sugar phosphate isomerase/epimerase [Ethanoligenens sp.]
MMEVGISTACLYPMETEQALSLVLEQGARTVEIFLNAENEYNITYLRRLQVLLARVGGTVSSIHPYTAAYESMMFFSDYPSRFADSVAQYRRTFAVAAFLGARAVVFHGARKDLQMPMVQYCERFGRLARAAREEGVLLAQENVSRCKCGSSENIAAMRKILGEDVQFVLDVKQVRRAGESLADMCAAMAGRIACVHLSDAAPGRDCLLPGAGETNLSVLHTRLAAQGFQGPLLIEVYRTGFLHFSELNTALSTANRIFSCE